MKKLTLLLILFVGFQSEAADLFDKSQSAPESLAYGVPSDMKKGDAFFEKWIKTAEDSKSTALLIIKDDKVIVEKYWDQEMSQPIRLHSVTKSIVSLALGKLVDESRLSLGDNAKTWFRNWSGKKEEIRVQQLLSQTSGYPDSSKEVIKGPNRLQLAIDEKDVSSPGSGFAYSNMGSWLVGEIVHQVSKKPADEYIVENFFKPMGIQKWVWEKDAAQNVDTSAGLQLSARDLAKFGKLMLSRGKWNQENLISEKYIDAATRSAGEKAKNYGYLWWVNGENFYARGDFGQILAIYPNEKVILVRLQKTDSNDHVEGSATEWDKFARQFGNQIKK